jgi:hypothetical protein
MAVVDSDGVTIRRMGKRTIGVLVRAKFPQRVSLYY